MDRIEPRRPARDAAAGASRHRAGALCRAAGDYRSGGKTFEGFGGTRVMEIIERFQSDAYRAVYTAHFDDAVYVLHVFQKKSKSGIATPKHEIDLIRKRYAEAERRHRERQN